MTPIGSQQMVGLMVDMMRSALTKYPASNEAEDVYAQATDDNAVHTRTPHRPPAVGPPLLMYVMAHFPGNTINSWRRQFFGDIAHGIKFFDLFSFVPSYSGYTCDYVDGDGGAYTNVRRALNELGTFEDIVQQGTAQAQGAAVAVLASESSNYWLRNAGTQGAATRTLYIALKHGGFPVDFVIEQDCTAGNLKYYSALFVVAAQVSEVATTAITAWANSGGIVIATAGAFSLNEYNLTSTSAQALLHPVNQTALFVGHDNTCSGGVQDHRCRGTRVQLSKQDLAFVSQIDRVFVSDGSAPERSTGVYGEKAMISVVDDNTSTVEGTFGDGSIAVLNITRGKGTVWFAAFHPGLSYFRTALPDTEPPCKGSTDDSYNHWIPTNFDLTAANIIWAPLLNIPGARPVTTNPSLVEAGIVTSVAVQGTVIPLINWSGDTVETLIVILHFKLDHAITSVTTATGANVTMATDATGQVYFTLPLEIAADAIILRA